MGNRDLWDSESRRYILSVHAPTGQTKHTINISSEFFSDNDSEDMVTGVRS